MIIIPYPFFFFLNWITEYDISQFCAGTAQDYKAMKAEERRQHKKTPSMQQHVNSEQGSKNMSFKWGFAVILTHHGANS